MAAAPSTTSRRGIIAGMVTAPLAASALAGAPVPTVSTEHMASLVADLNRAQTAVLTTGVAYREMRLEGRHLAYRQAQDALALAIDDILCAGEAMGWIPSLGVH